MRMLLPILFAFLLGACATPGARPSPADGNPDAAAADPTDERDRGHRAALWSGVGVGLIVIAAAAKDDDDDAAPAATVSGLCLGSTLSVKCW